MARRQRKNKWPPDKGARLKAPVPKVSSRNTNLDKFYKGFRHSGAPCAWARGIQSGSCFLAMALPRARHPETSYS